MAATDCKICCALFEKINDEDIIITYNQKK